MGGLSGSVVDVGIDDFITQVRDQVTPGTSALFLLTSDAVADRSSTAFVARRWSSSPPSLSQEDEEKLRTAFEHEGPLPP